ncbi:NIMA-interacting protein tinc [Massariosphaeria phaeospora]|uniref:NIMA-interacting protein tinc n=1 Tax=Massariosphaeria phaeospora TaxID=100035 RepID=A0A7C8IB29_9PLEO|nr:NIMA-interacting protein tinc [Massariosphaeria phaeospora]
MPPPKLDFGSLLLPCLILLVFWARPAQAFGAGNIASSAKIEGIKWRHGDIEDTLLTLLMSSRTGKKFSKMDVKRVYFGNWLRDYSQAVDVGTVKAVSSEAIRILLWVLGFLSFGYGTKEFEVTRDRLGCYRPEEHIDNPKDYADNLDARDYDRRLRGPVDERRELSVDERTGLKNYIASEDLGIATSAGLVRKLLHQCIDLGRRSGGKGPDFHEALRLLGTATHCLEDYSAHSNYIELALIELTRGERGDKEPAIFPHVGSEALCRVQGVSHPLYPLVTGTFGGVDFMHSVLGEINDKATQSELQELEGAISDADRKKNKSQIKDLLSKLPDGVFGGKDQSGKADELEQNAAAAQMGNMRITPKEPEAFTQQMGELVKQIYPIMEFHDEIMQSISEFIEQIPILPEIIESLQEQVSVFVFSLLAPYVLPIIDQVKSELETGSSEVIASAREKQHVVFNDPYSTDPTHSMLSKDHFTNILNNPAGQIASQVLKWVVPQVVQCWDGQADPERTVDTIIAGVFHHPALVEAGRNEEVKQGRRAMFNTVQKWWVEFIDSEKITLRKQLSRDGVQSGQNHQGKFPDHGHGCAKPLGMANDFDGIIGGKGGNKQYQQIGDQAGKIASEALGGGALGGLVGGLVGGIGGSLLGDAFGGAEMKSKKNEDFDDNGSYTQSYSEQGHHKKKSHNDSERHGQAEYRQTQYPGGGRSEEYSRREQDAQGGSYEYQQRVETTSYGGSGGYERHEERRIENGNQWQTEDRREGFDQSGEYFHEEKNNRKHGKKYGKNSEDEESGDEDDYEKRLKKEQKKREKEEKKKYKKYGSGDEDYNDDDRKHRSGSRDKHRSGSREKHRSQDRHKNRSGSRERGSGGYGQERRYGESEGRGHGRRQEESRYGTETSDTGYNRSGASQYGQESSGYERQQAPGYGGDSYASSGRQEVSGYGGDPYQASAGYERQETTQYGGESYSGGGGYRANQDDENEESREAYGSAGGYSGGYSGGGDEGQGRRY